MTEISQAALISPLSLSLSLSLPSFTWFILAAQVVSLKSFTQNRQD